MTHLRHNKHRKIAGLLLIPITFGMMLFLISIGTLPAVGQSDQTIIAYISSSEHNQEIRKISPDGTGDQTLWRIPVETAPNDGIGRLDWKPDGTELMFDSGHDWRRSMAIRDIFAVAPDGSQLRRINRPPGPQGSTNLPTGQVTFIVDAYENGDVELYIDGMEAPIEYFARSSTSYVITATVPDWGEGVRQSIRIVDPDPLSAPCLFSEEAWVDVVPGQLTDFGRIRFGITDDYSCPVLYSPSWSHDAESILFLRRDPSNVSAENNVWLTAGNPEVNVLGTRLINMDNYVFRDPLYRIVAAPTADKAGQFLFLENQLSPNILISKVDNPNPELAYNTDTCPVLSGQCEIMDVQWLPDSSGFIYSEQLDTVTSNPVDSGNIYQYDIESGVATPILTLENEMIGKIAISPDGAQIVFERGTQLADDVNAFTFGPRLLCPCSIWIVNSDGSGLRELVADGRGPVWSKVPPTVNQPPPTPTPQPGQTPQPTPTTPPINNPNVVPQVWFPSIHR